VEDRRDAYRALVWKHEGKRPFGIPTNKWKKDTKMYLREQ
jgi:hypothetical protein